MSGLESKKKPFQSVAKLFQVCGVSPEKENELRSSTNNYSPPSCFCKFKSKNVKTHKLLFLWWVSVAVLYAATPDSTCLFLLFVCFCLFVFFTLNRLFCVCGLHWSEK